MNGKRREESNPQERLDRAELLAEENARSAAEFDLDSFFEFEDLVTAEFPGETTPRLEALYLSGALEGPSPEMVQHWADEAKAARNRNADAFEHEQQFRQSVNADPAEGQEADPS